jgi:nitrite reductase (NO-forming)
MSTTPTPIDPHLSEDDLQALLSEEIAHTEDIEERTERLEMRQSLLAVIAVAAAALILIGLALFVIADDNGGSEAGIVPVAAAPAGEYAADTTDHAAAGGTDAKATYTGKVEPFTRVDPSLPATPAGAVKKFRVDVYEHVTKVSKKLPPTRVWSYGINGELNRGTGVSTPMVVTQGDRVEITLVNGADKTMDVQFPHSIDYHSSEVAPNQAFASIDPGETHTFSFTANHPGVFMYHCATQPVLLHTGAGMVGMMVVKPKDLAPVDRELWMTQQEFYVGKPGGMADEKLLAEKKPNAITFNGFANQYADHPITVKKGEKVRMYVMNGGPSIWSAFHVIGTVFDKTMVEGVEGHDAQTINLAPSQGGWVEFTLDAEGNFPFVTHAFGDMVTGALGVLATEHAPKGKSGH